MSLCNLLTNVTVYCATAESAWIENLLILLGARQELKTDVFISPTCISFLLNVIINA